MKDLRFIYIYLEDDDDESKNIVEFDKVSEYLPSSLRFMRWYGFPFSSLPNTFHGKYLVELDIRRSKIVQLWEDGEGKVLHKLKFLNISYSELRTFDLRLAPNLEQLTLDSCYDFEELHIPADHHSKLEHLYLCESKLTNLHLGNTPNLESLILEGCNDLVELHMPAETPNLKRLDLENCYDLVELHMPAETPNLEEISLSDSKLRILDLGFTPNLKRLNLENCYDLVEINAPVGCLKKLLFLDLSGCGRFESFVFDKWSQPAEAGSLSELHLIAEPTDVCPLHSDNDSPKLQFSCYYEEHSASSLGNIERLISIGLCACTNLESFSRSICSLRGLRKLKLQGSIPEVPRDLDQLECLEELTFSSREIKHLPDSICKLKHLKSFKIKSCWLLEKLPEDIGRLESLEKIILTNCRLLQDLPNSICKLKHLKSFEIKSCWLLENLPEDIGRLESLEKLILTGCKLLQDIPKSISKMKCINKLCLRGCIRVVELPEDIGCLEGLKELNINGTGISHLPQSIFLLKGLRIVGSMRFLDTYGLLLKRRRTCDDDDEIVCYI